MQPLKLALTRLRSEFFTRTRTGTSFRKNHNPASTFFRFRPILWSALGSSAVLLTACTSDPLLQQPAQHTSIKYSPSEAFNTAYVPSAADQAAGISRKMAVRSSMMSESAPVSLSNQHLVVVPHSKHLPQPAPEAIAQTEEDRERYQDIPDNPVMQVAMQPVSTFSVDVDTGSYSNIRRMLESGSLPPVDAVRIEELINYFDYDYPVPTDPSTPFSISTELAPSPWAEKRHLLHVGLQGFTPESVGIERPAANLVFLLDVSGSMQAPDKLPLLKSAIRLASKQLNEKDSVSIVVYAGASGVVLKPTPGHRHQDVTAALSQLHAGGSTHGAAGIELAYQLARQEFKSGGINRVVLATDGDFNVGISDIDRLKEVIARERTADISLTTLGFGRGNYNDHLMEQLADIGNGNHAYIDTLSEARKVLVEELDATLLTIAKDVKIQIEFNPATVSEYRLIGYVNRRLANEDFANDKVDAGDIGAGHTVTALYELALVGSGAQMNTPLRYANHGAQAPDRKTRNDQPGRDELLELRLRYKPVLDSAGKPLRAQPDRGGKSNDASADPSRSLLITQLVHKQDEVVDLQQTSTQFRFSAAVAAFGQLLRNGKYTGAFSLEDVVALATQARGSDAHGLRSEFLKLAKLAAALYPSTHQADGSESRSLPHDEESEQKG